jgi:hypothetical protein
MWLLLFMKNGEFANPHADLQKTRQLTKNIFASNIGRLFEPNQFCVLREIDGDKAKQMLHETGCASYFYFDRCMKVMGVLLFFGDKKTNMFENSQYAVVIGSLP